MKTWAAIVIALLLAACAEERAPAIPDAHRLLVLTDIEADPDDTQTLVRLLLYSNEIDIEGLVATTSVHQQDRIAPESIRAVIDAYEQVYPNLRRHAPNYPTADALRALVKSGQPGYGMGVIGEGRDTEGSDWIIRVLEEDDDRPLWVTAWGGANTLAQALDTIRRTRSAEDAARLIAKLRVYTISDQDDSGIWMRRTFPDLFYIVSPGGYGAGTWTGIMHAAEGRPNTEISTRWVAENIQQGHGPLGAIYPDVAYGVEGDTPSWLALIPNGLGDPDHPEWGGWGGRYELYIPQRADMDPNGFTGGVPIEDEPRAIWTNAADTYRPYVEAENGRATRIGEASFTDFRATVWRWREDFQNDFAARMDWTTASYDDANHPPVAALTHPTEITARSGERVSLDASASSDPDGDSLSFYWLHYPEAGTYRTPIDFDGAENLRRTWFEAPDVTEPQTAHFIVRVTDKGAPPLTRYRRVIVTINPRE